MTSRLCWCLPRYPFYCVCIQVCAVIHVMPVFMFRYEFDIVWHFWLVVLFMFFAMNVFGRALDRGCAAKLYFTIVLCTTTCRLLYHCVQVLGHYRVVQMW